MDCLKKAQIGPKELLVVAGIVGAMLLWGYVVMPQLEESALTYRVIKTFAESRSVWVIEDRNGSAISMAYSNGGFDSMILPTPIIQSHQKKVEVCAAQITKDGRKFLEIELPCTKDFTSLVVGQNYRLRESDHIRDLIIIDPHRI